LNKIKNFSGIMVSGSEFEPQHLKATTVPGLSKTTNIPSLNVPLMIQFARRTLKDFQK